ncbi:MAG: sulfurtransferase [Planctomycetota bacterium]|jgi:thiosulfate/3-mercaptopyruvate sulfurtransferase
MFSFRLLDPETAAAAIASDRVILEAQFSSIDHPPRDDRPLHVPGAIRVHPSYFEAGTDRSRYYPHYQHPGDGNLLPDAELTRVIERLGIAPDTPVIVYGREPEGTMAAARVAWALLYAGVHEVGLLDGGLDAWLEAGGETTAHIPSASDTNWTGPAAGHPAASWQVRTHLRASTDEVRAAATARGTSRLVDVRRRGEWDGADEDHYPFRLAGGHIPTAVHQGDWDTLVDHATKRMAPHVQAVARRWREEGILDACVQAGRKTLIFYCGTGWRSSIAFLVACLLGLPAKNYEDGFYGWSGCATNAIERATCDRIPSHT